MKGREAWVARAGSLPLPGQGRVGAPLSGRVFAASKVAPQVSAFYELSGLSLHSLSLCGGRPFCISSPGKKEAHRYDEPFPPSRPRRAAMAPMARLRAVFRHPHRQNKRNEGIIMTMKKLFAAAASALFALSLTACGAGSSSSAAGTSSTAGNSSAGEGYRIAIVQQMDHASLDEIRLAIEAELDAKAEELGITIEYKEFNGQNDPTLLGQIGTQVVSDGFDAIIPIATLAAQQMQLATEGTDIPVVFAAISDPEGAGMTGENVTGTSDALDTTMILDMMLAQNPDLKTVGLLYSQSEPNSALPIAQAKEYLDSKGIAYVERTGNTNDEVISALTSMLDQVDAIFTPTDNVVAAVELAIAPTMIEAGVPHYAGADSFVRNGAFATCGCNYTELGAVTADMAIEALQTGTIPAVQQVAGNIITVNTETAAGLGADYSMFADMAESLVEVTTTED